METLYDIAPEQDSAHIALIMLPGAKDGPRDFVDRGFIQALRQRHLPVDVVLVDAHMDYYLQENTTARLAEDIVTPLRARGYSRIWLLGLSLGGLGVLDFARAYPVQIEGVILLAPYLGSRGFVERLSQQNDLSDRVSSDIGLDPHAALLWRWMKAYDSGDAQLPAIYLGYGEEDRFASTGRLLAKQIPAANTIVIHGGHDWQTWITLWQFLLDKNPFAKGRAHAN